MTDNKLTDNEIIKALECCLAPFGARCGDCSLLKMNLCKDILLQNTLDLINRIQSENERLRAKLAILSAEKSGEKYLEIKKAYEDAVSKVRQEIKLAANDVGKIKAEAYKECIEKVKEQFIKGDLYFEIEEDAFCIELDNLLKELVGEDK